MASEARQHRSASAPTATTGRHIYAIAVGFSGPGAIYAAVSAFGHLSLPYAGMIGLLALLIGVLITWLRPFRVLYA